MNLHTIQTPEAAVTISWGDRNAPENRADAEPYVSREGAATVIVIGGLEILIDPEAVAADSAVCPTCLQPQA